MSWGSSYDSSYLYPFSSYSSSSLGGKGGAAPLPLPPGGEVGREGGGARSTRPREIPVGRLGGVGDPLSIPRPLPVGLVAGPGGCPLADPRPKYKQFRLGTKIITLKITTYQNLFQLLPEPVGAPEEVRRASGHHLLLTLRPSTDLVGRPILPSKFVDWKLFLVCSNPKSQA